jgi:hypothetical protein
MYDTFHVEAEADGSRMWAAVAHGEDEHGPLQVVGLGGDEQAALTDLAT